MSLFIPQDKKIKIKNNIFKSMLLCIYHFDVYKNA